jgi:hypothetical protein
VSADKEAKSTSASGDREPKASNPLNPAHAILGGAILSAIVGLTGVMLNIRSSERISNERDKRDAAVSEASQLKDKVVLLEAQLQEMSARLTVPLSSMRAAESPRGSPTSSPTPTSNLPAPPQSILVVVTIPPTPTLRPTDTSPPAAKSAESTRPAEPTTTYPLTTTTTTEVSATTTSTEPTTTIASSTTAPTSTALATTTVKP